MASGRFNTMAEGLQKIAADITGLMTTPDADLDFLTDLQTEVLTKLREPFEAMKGGAAAPGPSPDAGAGQMPPEIAAMMGGQMPPSPVPGMGGPMPGAGPGAPPMPGASTPNPDELRRIMG